MRKLFAIWAVLFFCRFADAQTQTLTLDAGGNVLNPTGANFPTGTPLTVNGVPVLTGNQPTTLTGGVTGTGTGSFSATVVINANLTGPITSSGNATAVASQTGTGSKFVMDTSPVLVTPTIGAATATSVNKLAITAPASSATLEIPNGTNFYGSNGGEVVLYVKNVAVLTAGAPADIATIAIPASITRWGVAAGVAVFTILVESQVGTTAAGTCMPRTAATGAGTALLGAAQAPPAVAATATRATGGAVGASFTGSTIYINQTVNSANAGNLSFYVRIQPLP